MKIYRLLIRLSLILSTSSVFASYGKDLEAYKALIDKIHPRAYQFTDEASFLDYYKNLEERADKLEKREFILELARLNGLLHCSHSKVRIPADYMHSISREDVFFPNVLVINEALELRDMTSAPDDGRRIISINGMSSENVVRNLLKQSSYDGENFLYAIDNLNESMPLALFFLFGAVPSFKVTVAAHNEKVQTYDLKSISLDEVAIKRDIKASLDHPSLKVLIFKGKSTAFIKVKSFFVDKAGFNSELKKIFQEIKRLKIRRIIIDLRDNHGGDIENAASLFSFITRKPVLFEFLAYVKKTWDYGRSNLLAINGKRVNKTNIKRINEYIKSYFNPSSHNHLLESSNLPINRFIMPLPQSFEGDVFLLINSNSRSTASLFASFFKSHQRGLILGEQSGGGSHSHNGNIIFTYRLSQSGILIELPLVHLRYKFFDKLESRKDSNDSVYGVQPDIVLPEAKVSELNAKGISKSVEAVLSYVDKHSKKKPRRSEVKPHGN